MGKVLYVDTFIFLKMYYWSLSLESRLADLYSLKFVDPQKQQ